MPYVDRNGQVLQQQTAFGLKAILNFLQAIVNFFIFFFKTIMNPSAADDYTKRSGRGGGGSGGGGGGPPRPRGPRITGLADMRDASGAAACGAGG